MAARTINIPNFSWSSFYYAEILEALILYKRQNVPELTDESDFEPFIQLLRAFALVGHLNNVLVDTVANESTLPTAALVESVRNMLRLIGYELSPATPATVDVVYTLSSIFTTSKEVIPLEAQVATRPSAGEDAIPFEALSALSVSRTDRLTACFAQTESGTFVDHTAAAIAGSGFAPSLNAAGRKLYWVHDSVMWDVLSIAVNVAAANITGVFEFYDGDFADTQPDSVTLNGSTLEFDLTALLGDNNRAGALVRVRSNDTAAYEDVVSTWNGSINIATTGYLGQTSPSLVAGDYQVGSEWTELATSGVNFDDNSSGLTVTGDVTYDLPQTQTLNWQKATINGTSGFALRWRTITSIGGTNPTLGLQSITTGKQYVLAVCTQGRTVQDAPLGSSNGTENQKFEMTREKFVSESETVTVDNVAWTRVVNFLGSTPQDQHYRIVLGENDKASVVFGDGAQGKIPPIGVANILCEYRVDAHQDGNVGAGSIVVDKTGLSFVSSLYNPRQASGWTEAEGSSEASLERAKIAGPASLRTKEVAISPGDLVELASKFTASDGSSPVSRAVAVEEGFGPKTVMLVVVGAGGAPLSQATLDQVDLYFNGDKYASPPKRKHFVANQEVTSVNYSQKVINVTATVTASSNTVAITGIVNQLAKVIQPEAVKADGVTYEWEFGETVPVSRLGHEIFNAHADITDVDISLPAIDVVLDPTELPVLGTVSITLVTP